jgi:hypothetical protein
MSVTGNSNIINRGGTVTFSTTFYDPLGNITQPQSAVVNIIYPTPTGTTADVEIQMTGPTAPAVAWTAEWDSRPAGAGTVYWSIHSGGTSPPYAVEDGQLLLTANPANMTF